MGIEESTILVTNDDGVHSPALEPLVNALGQIGQVTVVAPDVEKSAMSNSLTINNPLRITEVRRNGSLFGYAVSGTPIDCIKLGLGAILKKRPSLVISGINLGLNTGIYLRYSGTVCAAIEATTDGIPSIAVSAEIDKGLDFDFPSQFIVQLSRYVLENGLPEETFLNVNFPSCFRSDIKGVAITRHGNMRLKDSLVKRLDPRNNAYYWIKADYLTLEGGNGQDYQAINEGKISITPIRFHSDLTNYEYLGSLHELENMVLA
ncbi:MAG: 5'/3'-nucleotidase SurE [bacterium]